MKSFSPTITAAIAKPDRPRSRVINLNAIPAGPNKPSHTSIREAQRWIAPASDADWDLIRRLHEQ